MTCLFFKERKISIMKKTPLIIVAAAVVVIGLVAIIATTGKKDSTSTSSESSMSESTPKDSMASAPADAVATDKVEISNYKFGTGAIKVKVGTTVTWTNTDPVRHNVVADDGGMPNGDLFGKGETYSYTFTKAGVFKYHCTPHPYMHGTVVVE